MPHTPTFIVVKFGGTSVVSKARWDTIAAIARAHVAAGLKTIVVCSAVTGISNALEKALKQICAGKDIKPILKEITEKHKALASELGVDFQTILGSDFAILERLLLGASLVGEVTPRIHAHVMAFGELLSTKLGAAHLAAQGDKVLWMDARKILRASDDAGILSERRHYLSATCTHQTDADLIHLLASEPAPIILTQGFIASDSEGNTVLLGRGGSDTSAAYFAAKLQAVRCEIWTDVPGMYTANPRDIGDARLLKQLDYTEAQELASMGAKVLHPRCIAPLQKYNIPLHIRSTLAPSVDGTIISSNPSRRDRCIKAISAKKGITLVSIENLGMWQEVGFLANLFSQFQRHGLSVDLVSTSETNVTVSLDPLSNALNPKVLDALTEDLGALGKAQVIEACAAISLVGQNIRSILHQLGPVLELFEGPKVFLVSQAASDLNLTFVVEEEQADRLVEQLHQLLFGRVVADDTFGPTWKEQFGEPMRQDEVPAWWMRRQADLLQLARVQSPLYVYDQESLEHNARSLTSKKSIDRCFFAMKANNNAGVLKTLHALGIGFECVSLQEVNYIRGLFPDIEASRLLFTPNFAGREEYSAALALGCFVTLDNVYPLAHWPEMFAGRELLLRLDPGRGMGHHSHVQTAGEQSKFGISLSQLETVKALVHEHDVKVIGLHAHAGSGIQTPTHWRDTAIFLAQRAESFPNVRILDIGGGLPVASSPSDGGLDIGALDEQLMAVKKSYPQFEIWLEPGRYMVANAGVLLASVTQTKEKGATRFVGVDTGMNSLIRPALYGAYHRIVNLSRLHEPVTMTANVVGPICESGDTLGFSRSLPETGEGDVLLIDTAGAYGHVMGSEYNMREPAAETMLLNTESFLF